MMKTIRLEWTELYAGAVFVELMHLHIKFMCWSRQEKDSDKWQYFLNYDKKDDAVIKAAMVKVASDCYRLIEGFTGYETKYYDQHPYIVIKRDATVIHLACPV